MSFPVSSSAVARPCLRPCARPSRRSPRAARLTLSTLAAAAALSAAGAARADDPSLAAPSDPLPSQQVAVTATRLPMRVADTVADITVITREDLDHDTGLTLAEVLATQPGVQVTSNGGRGTASGIFLRGLEARHTLLLVDGVRVDSATLGLPSFDNLPVSLVDHIEIVRGPLSSIYGADAAGGVVQVFTRRAHAGVAGHVDLGLGSLGYRDAEAGIAYGGGGFDLAVDGSHTQDTGFSATNPKEPFGDYNPDRDGFGQDAANVRAGWQMNPDWRLEALALQSEALVHYDDGPGADARARLRNGVQSLTLTGKVLPGWRTTLRATRSRDDYETVASASAYATLGTIWTIERRLSWENAVDTPLGTALALLEKTSQDVSMPGTAYVVSSRDLGAAALALDGSAGAHTWQASLRRDHNSQFGNETTGGAGYAYAITPGWHVGASYGTSFVAPSFNQLYYPFGYGNPDLKSERGHSTELNTRWADDVQEARLTLYRQRMRGYITPGDAPTNIDRVSIDGLTLAWERRWHDGTLGLSYDHLTPMDDTHGTPLVRRARNDAKAIADWQFGAYSVGGTLTAYSSRPDTTYDANFNPAPVTLGGYATLDLRADWKPARDWSLGVRLNNAADKVYETAYGYNQPRREYYVVLSWRTP